MLSLRSRIFIIVGIVVLVIAVVGVALFIRSRANKETPGQNPAGDTLLPPDGQGGIPTGSTQQPTEIPAGLPVRQASSEEILQNGVKQLARVFVERYGTYSSDNNSQNVTEVQVLVTPEVWQRIKPQSTTPATSFVGVTTQVVTMEMKAWTPDTAELYFKTVRTQQKDGATTTSQQNITVTMVRSGSSWLVSNFVWEK